MKLTKDFSKKEFDCKDGSEMPASVLANIKLVANELQIVRDYIGKPIVINSGYRSPNYNKKVGGAKNSQHLLGKASDIRIAGKTPLEIYLILEHLIAIGKIKQGGLGLYNTFVHYDIRGFKTRWNNSRYKVTSTNNLTSADDLNEKDLNDENDKFIGGAITVSLVLFFFTKIAVF